jgi:hypothetical protein
MKTILLFVMVIIMAIPELSNAGIPQSTIEELTRTYTAAAERVAKIVLEPGNSPAKIARAHQLSMQIDDALNQLKAYASKWTGNAISGSMAAGIARADQQAVGVGLDIDPVSLRGAFGLIDHGTAIQFARDTAGDLYKAADNMGERAKRLLHATAQKGLDESEINRILAGGAIDGQPRETIRQLRVALEAVHKGTVPITCKDGTVREYETGYYAQMVARTKTRQATTQSRHDRLQSMGLDLVSIIGRVSKNFCTAYLGQVFSLGGKSDKYPALSSLPGGGPPFHPNCTKSTRPFVEALASASEMDHADGIDDGMLGLTPSQAAYRFRTENLFPKVKENYRPWMASSGAK